MQSPCFKVPVLMQELLLAYGEYPAKYRLLVWDFLLRLPHNSEAFQVRRQPICL